MKKAALKVIVCMILCAFISTVYATEYCTETICVEEQKIDKIPYEISKIHDDILKNNNEDVKTFDEYDLINVFRNKSESQLKAEGYSIEKIKEIKSDEVEKIITEEIFNRSKLDSNQLKGMGYTSEEIIKLKKLNGSESIEELSKSGLLATCSVYNTYYSHTYKTARDKTFFVVAYGWEWNRAPSILGTDCAGVGWNHDFTPDNSIDNSYNITYKTYVNLLYSTMEKYSSTNMVEKYMQTSEDVFDLNELYGEYYYVKSGYGIMCLSQTGKVNDVKFTFKYGHNETGLVPSVGFPWSIGFTLEEAETVFVPPQLVYHDFAIVE